VAVETAPENGVKPGSAAGRDVVLITLDTTRADRLGCYGYRDPTGGSPTPNLDRLAARGVRFGDAVSPVPMTLPAHTSILTGLEPPHHGVRANGEYRLAPEHTTLAEVLAAAGYDTAAFVSSFVLAPRFGLDQGFATYDANLQATRRAVFGQQNERSGKAVTDAALAWLGSHGQSAERKPFFLWVHYFDPHDPYAPPEPFASRYADHPYEGEIAFMDAQVGRLLDGVAAAEGEREPLIVAAGDHGESLGEHAERYHSRTLYEGAVHVPLLIVAADLIPSRVDDGEVVGLVDVAPTVLDLLGLAPGETPDGESLLPALAGRPDGGQDRTLYLETLNTYLDTGWAPLYALRRHDAKYIEAPRPELYDLANDPHEQHDLLAGKQPEAADGAPPDAVALAAALRHRLESQPGVVEAAARRQPVDPEVRQRLAALGYLSGGGSAPPDAADLPDPKDMLPLHDKLLAARAALAQGDPGQAVRLGRELVRAAPRDRAALQLLGEAYATMGDLKHAEQALRRHLEIGPSVAATVLLAQVVMQQGRFQDAEALLDAAAELDPGHGAVPLARGDLRLAEGRPDEARALYRKAAEIDPVRFAGLSKARLERLERLLARR